MSSYIQSTAEIRRGYATEPFFGDEKHNGAYAEFDRWLAAHDAGVAAAALRAAAGAWSDWDALSAPVVWLRDRADTTETRGQA